MASLSTNIADLTTTIASALKTTRVLVNANAADLSALTTTAQSNLVAAINEVNAAVAGATGIDDANTSGSTTWSSSKIDSELDGRIGAATDGLAAIDDDTPSTTAVYSSTKTDDRIDTAISDLVGGAGPALDTLAELAAALGEDENFSTTVSTALDNRVRYDAAQTISGGGQTQARANIGAAAASDLTALTTNVGTTGTDFAAAFVAALA